MQNTTHAVMAQRTEPRGSLDDFPTPPWATRALAEYILPSNIRSQTCLEPACGAGHMVKPLREYFQRVDGADIADYDFGEVRDFLQPFQRDIEYDWIITNPPFGKAEEFVRKSIEIAKIGVAILVRTVFIESVGRYGRLFSKNPPSIFAPFVERVPMVKGRLDQSATTATSYSWIVWNGERQAAPSLVWIPPCRRVLERMNDYRTDHGQMSLIDRL